MLMKRFGICTLLLLALACSAFAQPDFRKADSLFSKACDYKAALAELSSLELATQGKAKAEVLWRMARIQLILGQEETDKEGKRRVFGQGIRYAEQGISLDSRNAGCYFWHCANVGRECQTRGKMQQASKVSVMMKDLEMILNTLDRTDYSEAWQALAEIYYHHPFKSTNAAINYARKAIDEIPSDESRLSSCIFLAQMLRERDWSASRRREEINDNIKELARLKNGKSTNINRFALYSAIKDTAVNSCRLAELSDAQEAQALVKYALEKYRRLSFKSKVDEADYKQLLKL